MYDVTSPTTSPPAVKKFEASFAGLNLDDGIILDAGRETRIKIYMGQVRRILRIQPLPANRASTNFCKVFMGWLWFVPTFHMPQPPPSCGLSPPSTMSTPTKTTFLLTRKDLDFPLGLGSAIIDVEIELEWVPPAAGSPTNLGKVQEPAGSPRTEDSQVSGGGELGQSVLVAAVQAVVGGTAAPEAVREAVEGRQAMEEG